MNSFLNVLSSLGKVGAELISSYLHTHIAISLVTMNDAEEQCLPE